VKLAGDDSPAARKAMNERIDELLIVKTHFAARRIAALIAHERAETVYQAIGLRAVIVRQDLQVPAQDDGAPALVACAFFNRFFAIVDDRVFGGDDARYRHRFRPAGQLPKALVTAPH